MPSRAPRCERQARRLARRPIPSLRSPARLCETARRFPFRTRIDFDPTLEESLS